jgi:hypothetical protein
LEKANSLFEPHHFFSGGFSGFFFLAHFSSGFQFIGFPNLVLSFQFSFWRWSKFWLILTCGYLAYLFTKSFWQKFFASALFAVGFYRLSKSTSFL